ncbi:MAG TPA: amidohydrolase family protein [Gemmatimonadales bacterium]
MSLRPALLGLLCAVAGGLSAPGAPGRETTVFRDVNVVPMDRERVLPHRSVVVRGDRIVTILPADAALPEGARVIEGGGTAYLIPGLHDMHVHLLERGELLLYLANGITTVRNLHGLPRHLAWRDSIERGTLPGPRLVTSGPILDGHPPARSTNTVLRSAADANRAVAAQKAAGYDAIKIYDNVPRDLYAALGRAARRHGVPMVGHLPTPVGLAGLLEVGAQRGIEHVEELLPLFDDGRDTSGLGSVAAGLRRAGVWVTPTLTVHRSALEQARDWAADQRRPELAYLHPGTARSWGWTAAGEARSANPAAAERFARTTAFFERALVPALHQAGVKLLAGSDAPIPTIMPGFGLASELRALAAAGLTPYDALVAATRNPAEFLGRGAWSGTVTPGRAADLLLLSANPLEDIGNVERRLGVMRAGRWHPQSELRALMQRQVAAQNR